MDTNNKLKLNINYQTKRELYVSFMPFLKEGGLFIRTEETYELGDEIDLTLKLLEDAGEYHVKTKVAWLSPKFAQGNLPQGIGVQFIDSDSRKIRDRIENYLAGISHQEPTDSM
jgi:type IV pilus assembly protein PilZ